MNITQEQHEQVKRELGFELVAMGQAVSMPGTNGFTMVAFYSKDVPPGTEVFIVKEVE